MLNNPFLSKMTEFYRQASTGIPMPKAALNHHEKQRELRKRHYTLLTQTLAQTRDHVMQGNFQGIQNSYKNYMNNALDLMKQSMSHYAEYTQNNNHMGNHYANMTSKTFENIVSKVNKVKSANPNRNFKKANVAATMASIGSLMAAPVAKATVGVSQSKPKVATMTKSATASKAKTVQSNKNKVAKKLTSVTKKVAAKKVASKVSAAKKMATPKVTTKAATMVKKSTPSKVVKTSVKSSAKAKVTPIAKKTTVSKSRVTPVAKSKRNSVSKVRATTGTKVSLTSLKTSKVSKNASSVKKLKASKGVKVSTLGARVKTSAKPSSMKQVKSYRA